MTETFIGVTVWQANRLLQAFTKARFIMRKASQHNWWQQLFKIGASQLQPNHKVTMVLQDLVKICFFFLISKLNKCFLLNTNFFMESTVWVAKYKKRLHSWQGVWCTHLKEGNKSPPWLQNYWQFKYLKTFSLFLFNVHKKIWCTRSQIPIISIQPTADAVEGRVVSITKTFCEAWTTHQMSHYFNQECHTPTLDSTIPVSYQYHG